MSAPGPMVVSPLPRRVLVVGATSHVGERLCLRLRRLGVNVDALTRDPGGEVAQRLAAAGCRLHEGDTLRRWMLWNALAQGAEQVISCTEIVHAEALLQASYRTGVERLVCVSSSLRRSRVPSPAALAARHAEVELMESEQAWTILRPTLVYGGRRDGACEALLQWARRHSWLPTVGGGRSLLQPAWVEDLVSAIIETMRRPRTAGRAYDLGGPAPLPWIEFAQLVWRACGRPLRPVDLPVGVARGLARGLPTVLGRRGLSPEVVERLLENRPVDLAPAARDLDYRPLSYDQALAMKVSGEAEVERLYAQPATQPAPAQMPAEDPTP